MACYQPIKAYKLVNKVNENGKSVITFNKKDISNDAYVEMEIPCNQCIGCRIDKSREWALRCCHEASMYGMENNCFITLTYDDDHYPENGSLNKTDFQKFMKRLRKHAKGIKAVEVETNNKVGEIAIKIEYPIRFFHCGEYGDKHSRPHHHAALFNYDFPDKVEKELSKSGDIIYTSEILGKLWPNGFHYIGSLTFSSAAYIARYITKKVLGKKADDHYRVVNTETGEIVNMVPEFVTMSRRPGIGYRWAKKYAHTDIYSKDYLTYDGKKFMCPKYYDNVYEKFGKEQANGLKEIKKKRAQRAGQKIPEPMARKLAEKRCKELQARKLKRNYENDS
jgi:hypothetical protein